MNSRRTRRKHLRNKLLDRFHRGRRRHIGARSSLASHDLALRPVRSINNHARHRIPVPRQPLHHHQARLCSSVQLDHKDAHARSEHGPDRSRFLRIDLGPPAAHGRSRSTSTQPISRAGHRNRGARTRIQHGSLLQRGAGSFPTSPDLRTSCQNFAGDAPIRSPAPNMRPTELDRRIAPAPLQPPFAVPLWHAVPKWRIHFGTSRPFRNCPRSPCPQHRRAKRNEPGNCPARSSGESRLGSLDRAQSGSSGTFLSTSVRRP